MFDKIIKRLKWHKKIWSFIEMLRQRTRIVENEIKDVEDFLGEAYDQWLADRKK